MAFKKNEQICCTECSQTVLAGDVVWATTWVHIKTHSKRQGREAGWKHRQGRVQVGGRSAPGPWGPPCLRGLSLPAAFAFPANVRLHGPSAGPQQVSWPMIHTSIRLVRCRDNSVLPHLWLATHCPNEQPWIRGPE